MKTATLPAIRVAPELREAAEALLGEGETLSGFVEHAVRASIETRRLQQEFVARGLAARDDARRTGEYYTPEDIRDDLDAMLDRAKTSGKTAR
jgi:predicted transcriptional regulator